LQVTSFQCTGGIKVEKVAITVTARYVKCCHGDGRRRENI